MQRMKIGANHDRGKKTKQKNKNNPLTRQRKRSVKALFWFFWWGFSSPADLRRGADLRVSRSVWSRLTPSRSGRLHPLLTAAATRINPAQRSVLSKKGRCGGCSERRRKTQVQQLPPKLPSLTQVHERAGELQL